MFFRNFASPREFRAWYPGRNEANGLSALRAARVRGGSSWDDCLRGRGRKEGSEGGKKALACANRGASFRAARCASRLHLPEIHHLCVPPPPSSPAPFYLLLPSCFCLHLFPLLLCSLTSHGTQLPTTSLSWPAITQAPLATRNSACAAARGIETLWESPWGARLRGRTRHDRSSEVWSLLKLRCRATNSCWILADVAKAYFFVK